MVARGMENSKYQGAKWITRERRLAIYMRDGLACVYCGDGIETGVTLSLDHVVPFCDGGGTENENLLTACKRCNSSRGNRTVWQFCKAVAEYLDHDVKAQSVYDFTRRTVLRTVDVVAAKRLIESRGGYSAALEAAREEIEQETE